VVLASGKVQLVEFFAFWCGTCRAMAPVLHELEAEYDSRVNFIYVDIDDPATAGLKAALHFRLQPQFFLLDPEGRVIKQWQDFVSAEEFKVTIDDALK
jgi:thioredoxin 1